MVLCAAFGCNNRTDRGKSNASETDTFATSSSTPSGDSAARQSDSDSVSDNSELTSKKQDRQQHLSSKQSFHIFPKEGPRREKWLAAFNREKTCLTLHSQLCSTHFRPECFEDTYWLKVSTYATSTLFTS